MKLVIREDSQNYAATILRLPKKQAVQGLDKLVKVTVFGNDVLTGKDTPEDSLYVFFPCECALSEKYLSENSEYRHTEKNKDRSHAGFFEDSGRVKAIKFKGVISTGYIAPVSSLDGVLPSYDKLKEGDEFTEINGIEICRKYRPARTQSVAGTKESRFNNKLKRFDRLVPNQFRFHVSTSPLAKNLHHVNPEDQIVITDKWHGTSAVFSNLLVKKEQTRFQKVIAWCVTPWIKAELTHYANIYSSRSVVKNQYINKTATIGYYNEDIWGIVNKELEGKIEQGISIFGEVVGYLPSGKMIQNGYDYGCDVGMVDKAANPLSATNFDLAQHKFLVYRITYTKPDGTVIEFSWQQIKDYCKRNELETVVQLYHGGAHDLVLSDPDSISFSESMLSMLERNYLEKDCTYCKNKVPAEGIVLRVDGKETFMAFKLKAKRFLERETKEIDKGEENIEDQTS